MGNAQTYCRPENVRGSQLALPCTASFQAKTGQKAEDDTPPVVLELEMEPRTSVGYNTTLRVRAADDRSGVDTIRARFENDEYGVIVFSLYPDLEREGWFTGHIPGARLTRWDQYELTRLVVADKAGNRRTYLPEAGARGEALPRQVVLTVDDNRD